MNPPKNHFNFKHLPNDIHLALRDYFPIQDQVNLSKTSQTFRHLYQDISLSSIILTYRRTYHLYHLDKIYPNSRFIPLERILTATPQSLQWLKPRLVREIIITDDVDSIDTYNLIVSLLGPMLLSSLQRFLIHSIQPSHPSAWYYTNYIKRLPRHVNFKIIVPYSKVSDLNNEIISNGYNHIHHRMIRFVSIKYPRESEFNYDFTRMPLQLFDNLKNLTINLDNMIIGTQNMALAQHLPSLKHFEASVSYHYTMECETLISPGVVTLKYLPPGLKFAKVSFLFDLSSYGMCGLRCVIPYGHMILSQITHVSVPDYEYWLPAEIKDHLQVLNSFYFPRVKSLELPKHISQNFYGRVPSTVDTQVFTFDPCHEFDCFDFVRNVLPKIETVKNVGIRLRASEHDLILEGKYPTPLAFTYIIRDPWNAELVFDQVEPSTVPTLRKFWDMYLSLCTEDQSLFNELSDYMIQWAEFRFSVDSEDEMYTHMHLNFEIFVYFFNYMFKILPDHASLKSLEVFVPNYMPPIPQLGRYFQNNKDIQRLRLDVQLLPKISSNGYKMGLDAECNSLSFCGCVGSIDDVDDDIVLTTKVLELEVYKRSFSAGVEDLRCDQVPWWNHLKLWNLYPL